MRFRTLIILSTWFIFVNARLEDPDSWFAPIPADSCPRAADDYPDRYDAMDTLVVQPVIVPSNESLPSPPVASGDFLDLRKMMKVFTSLFLSPIIPGEESGCTKDEMRLRSLMTPIESLSISCSCLCCTPDTMWYTLSVPTMLVIAFTFTIYCDYMSYKH